MPTKPRFFGRFSAKPRSVLRNRQGIPRLSRVSSRAHEAGMRENLRTEPGVPSVFAVNVLAPYILTALIERPPRLVYVSSGMHRGVRPHMDDLLWTQRPW